MKGQILFAIGGLLGGVLITSLFFLVLYKQPVRQTVSMDHSQMSMQEMNTSLDGKTGDDFDKLFLEQMIVHHQGAIDMAKLASMSANHQEIKDLSGNITTAQEQEITQMRAWQKAWGYTQ